MSGSEATQLYQQHVNPAFIKLLGLLGYGRVFVRARDVWLWDADDRRYLDMLAGFGSVNLGHNPARLIARLKAFFDDDPLLLNHVGPSVEHGLAAQRLARSHLAPLEVCAFTTGGAEAVEAAIKIARAATRRPGLLHCEGSYHGTSLGTLSIMGEQRLRKITEPLLPGCRAIRFGDLDALRKALSDRSMAAFVVEPIPAEAGVILPERGYLAEAQSLCRKYGTLLVLDEVQTGMGRTGALYAYQQEGFVPDLITLAKSLGGGVIPVGAAVTSGEIAERAFGSMDRFDLNAATFAGHGLGSVAVIECLDILRDEKLVENAAVRGTRFLEQLRARLAGHPLVRDVRGRGLLVAVELGPTASGLLNRLAPGLVSAVSEKVFGQWLSLRLLEQGIVCQPASLKWNVLRLEPPLTIPEEELSRTVEVIGGILDEYRDLGSLLKDAGLRLGAQSQKGWSFP